MMYNKERKLTYIDETKEDKKTYEQVMKATFDNTSKMECELDKDISTFTQEEIIEFYKSLNTTSLERLLVVDNNIKRYAKWCVEKGINDNSDYHYSSIDINVIKTCTNERANIISREDLIKEISILPNVSDRFLCLALFEGISGTGYNELIGLKMDAFEKQGEKYGYVVHLPNRDLGVSEYLVDLAKESATTDRLYMYAEGLSFVTREYQKSDNIIKYVAQSFSESDRAKTIRVQNKLLRIQQYLGNPAISKIGLMESGRVDMVRNLAAQDGQKSFELVIKNHDDEITQRYGKIRVRQRWVDQYRKYLEA